MPDYVDISKQLRDQLQEYVRLRDRAANIAKLAPNSDLGGAMTEQCKALDAAIASIDVALRLCRGSL
jgi:hypothetical protein